MQWRFNYLTTSFAANRFTRDSANKPPPEAAGATIPFWLSHLVIWLSLDTHERNPRSDSVARWLLLEERSAVYDVTMRQLTIGSNAWRLTFTYVRLPASNNMARPSCKVRSSTFNRSRSITHTHSKQSTPQNERSRPYYFSIATRTQKRITSSSSAWHLS